MTPQQESDLLKFPRVHAVDVRDIRECPRCYSLVTANRAGRHWWGQHQMVVYRVVIAETGYISILGSNEKAAVQLAERFPEDIVYGIAVDR